MFCRTINELDMKHQKGGIRHNHKIFGLSKLMAVPFAWIRQTGGDWGPDQKNLEIKNSV